VFEAANWAVFLLFISSNDNFIKIIPKIEHIEHRAFNTSNGNRDFCNFWILTEARGELYYLLSD
jgi:hypothetical protein